MFSFLSQIDERIWIRIQDPGLHPDGEAKLYMDTGLWYCALDSRGLFFRSASHFCAFYIQKLFFSPLRFTLYISLRCRNAERRSKMQNSAFSVDKE